MPSGCQPLSHLRMTLIGSIAPVQCVWQSRWGWGRGICTSMDGNLVLSLHGVI